MGSHAQRVDELYDRAVERHGARVGLFLVQFVRDHALAEDLLQETLLAAYRDRERLAEVDDAAAWLFAIARNRALDAHRRRRRHREALERLARVRRAPVPEPGEAAAVRDALERHLEPQERALVILRYLHGFDSQELAAIVGASPEAVRQRLSRARRKLVDAAGPPPAPARGPRGIEVSRAVGPEWTPEDDVVAGLLAPLARLA